MELVPTQEFFRRTIGGRPNQMRTWIYGGRTFECACGQWHEFATERVPVLRELPGMKLVLACPDGVDALTCVKVKGLVRFRLESLFGTTGEEAG